MISHKQDEEEEEEDDDEDGMGDKKKKGFRGGMEGALRRWIYGM